MAKTEKLEEAIKNLKEYRDSSLCGYCRNNADLMMDALQATIDIDRNVEQVVKSKMAHPGFTQLPRLNRELHELRDKSYRMLDEGTVSGQVAEKGNTGNFQPLLGGVGQRFMARGGGTEYQATGQRVGPLRGLLPLNGAKSVQGNTGANHGGGIIMDIVDSIRPRNLMGQWRGTGVRRRYTENEKTE